MDLDDTKLEISIEPSSNLRHEQTLVAGASSVPQDESRGLNEMTPQHLNSLKKQVCNYARKDKWKEAESIFNKYPDMIRVTLHYSRGTALHVAVEANSITFVKGLVNLMIPDDLAIQDTWGFTAFCVAALLGNSDLVQIMVGKNQNLPLIKSEVWLPVHWAANEGHHKIVQDLSSKTLLQKMYSKDIERLFFLTIEQDMFDVATKVFEEYPAVLAIATYGMEDQTALEMLLLKPSKELNKIQGNNRGASSGESLQLLKKVWLQLKRRFKSEDILPLGDGMQLVQKVWLKTLESEEMERLESELLPVLFNTIESRNNDEAVKLLLHEHHKLLRVRDPRNGQSILHCAVRNRRSSIVNYIFDKMWVPDADSMLTDKDIDGNNILHLVDDDGNNILHLAAYPLEKEETSSTLRPATRMRREFAWFKEIEKKAHPNLRTTRNREGKTPKDVFPELRTVRNKEGKTPMDVFKVEHKGLSQEVKDAAKGIADSGMLVAALVATVAFAAALTVPGHKTSPWFVVFILANAAALLTSSASILSFLSNFTSSRFADSEFVVALHPSLILGPILLLISIISMVISFAAAFFLIFEHTSKWAAYAVALMGIVPILLFFLFHFSCFDFLWARYYRLA